MTWETCTLRKWLNQSFLNDAFSGDERSQISMTKVTADKNPEYDTDPGKDTEDKVFLLSIPEAEKYFSSDDARCCKPTAYAVEKGAYAYEYDPDDGEENEKYDGNGWWWLRSPGNGSGDAASVGHIGDVHEYGDSVDDDRDLVRPALWINL